MNSKEIVYRAIERRTPPRTPIHYFNRDLDLSDTYQTTYAPAAAFAPTVPGESEWGFIWNRLDDTMGQPGHPPFSRWEGITRYTPPDPFASGRFEHLQQDIAEHSDKFVKLNLGITGFNVATFLRGFDQFMLDLCQEPEKAVTVMSMVGAFENGIIDQAVTYPIDAIGFGDDWGMQQGLLISPRVWRAVFRPFYAEQFARVHRAGKKVWFHTCGDVFDIIGDLIEIGVDVLELLQPDVFGVERLAERFGGKVCFCCSIDHQRRAISGTRDEIHAYARLLRDRLGCYDGGFIAYIEDYASLGMSEQNYQWIREAFHGLDQS